MLVWRREEDVRHEVEARGGGFVVGAFELGDAAALRMSPGGEHKQLTAATWRWDKLDERDPMRYPADEHGRPWMYWESFWAPADEATYATSTPAFGDARGEMLRPTLGDASVASVITPTRKLESGPFKPDTEQAVSSTATGSAMKDRAYAIVYQYNVWGSDVSRSGTGSDLWSPEARLAVTALEAVIDRLGVRSIVDCACGDATWIVPFFVARHPEIDYTGVDIVPEVIEENRRRHPGVHFECLDAAESPLPSGRDLVFCKETMNHMPLADAESTIRRFAATGAKYLLTSVHQGSQNELGRDKRCYTTYIKYDYALPPFNLRKVADVIEYQGLETSYTLYELPKP